ncbi:hypothetical protein PGT21_000002, partial [Puccinia graminis f. sp. tritici]
ISDRSVESDSNIQCDQPRISPSTSQSCFPISSHHSITPAAARERLDPKSPLSPTVPSNAHSSSHNSHFTHMPLRRKMHQIQTDLVITYNDDTQRKGFNSIPSSDNVPMSTHPAEKASNPESSSPHETDLVLTYRQRHTQRERLQFQAHLVTMYQYRPTRQKKLKSRASNPESSSSNPQEVVTKEKPLFRPESPLSIHNLPPSNPHSSTQSSPVTTHQAEKDHALPLSTSEDSDKVHHGGQDKDGQNDGKQEMVDGSPTKSKNGPSYKINVNSTSLDKYDMYADPILLEAKLAAGINSMCSKKLTETLGWNSAGSTKPGTDSSGILWLDGNRWLSVQNIMADEKCLSQMLAQCPSITPDIVNPSQYHSGGLSDASRTSLSRLTQITRNAASSLEALVMPPQQKSTSSKEELEREGCRAALNFLFDRTVGVGCCTSNQREAATKHLGGKNDLDENLRIASWYCSDLSGIPVKVPRDPSRLFGSNICLSEEIIY